jgi:hypothetical protein
MYHRLAKKFMAASPGTVELRKLLDKEWSSHVTLIGLQLSLLGEPQHLQQRMRVVAASLCPNRMDGDGPLRFR